MPCLKINKPPPRGHTETRSPPRPPTANYKSKNKSVDISTPVLQDTTNKQSNTSSAKSLFAKFTGRGSASYTEDSNSIPPPKMTLISKPQPAPPPKTEFKPSPKPALKPVPKPPAKPQNSNSSLSAMVHDPIVKKDSFNNKDKEISKPVLISTTNRSSMAFVRDNSFENNNKGVTPPVPPHAAKKRDSSGAPPRPTSLPPQPHKLKFSSEDKKDSRKSVVDPNPKSPPRPPPPNFTEISLADPPQKSSEPPRRKIFDKAKYRIEAEGSDDDLPLAKNRSPAGDRKKVSDSEAKSLRPLLSTNKAKTSIEKKLSKPEMPARGKVPLSSQSSNSPRVISSKPHVSRHASNSSGSPRTSSSSVKRQLTAQDSDSSVQESPAVAHIKAMFDSMDVGSKPLEGSSSGGAAVTRTNSGGNGDRPRPPPKPGASSKFRSVNV